MIKKVKLGDVLDVKRGASLSGEYYSETGEKIRLTLGNFNYPSGGFKNNTSKTDIYFTGNVKPEFIMKKGDIITPLTEQVAGLLGETARIPEDDLYIQSGDIGLVVPNPELLDDSFAYYLLPSPIVKKQLGAGAQQTKIRHTSPEKIKDCDVWIPEMPYQKFAGALLDSINAKISNNNRINAELESMAKTIYDYWFTQFDFPDENGKPYKSSGGKMVWNEELKREIPEGWEAKPLSALTIYPIDKISNQQIDSYNYIGTDNLIPEKKGRIPSSYTPKIGQSTMYIEKDILISNIRPYFKKIWFAQGIGGCSSDVLCIRSRQEGIEEFLFNTLAQDAFFSYDTAGAKGSKMPRGDKNHIMNYMIPYDKSTALNFSANISEFFKKMECIYQENQKLASLRDWLLPMLMNGQVGFKEE